MIATNLGPASNGDKKLRVALVNAPSLSIIEPFIDLPDYPRDALAYLAGYVRKFRPDVEIKIFDAKFQRMKFAELHRALAEFKPDVMGLTAQTNEIKPCAYVATKLKRQFPECFTVIGGAHATAIPGATLREFPGFDAVCVGEGEETFLELCNAVDNRASLAGIRGVVYRDGERIVSNGTRERILDQDTIPQPAWDLVPRAEAYWVQSQRGCPFNCVFCMNHNGRVARKRSIERVIAELEHLVDEKKAKFIRFGDELFSVDMDRTHQLLDAIIAAGLHRRMEWDCQTHVRFVNDELCRHLKAAGCARVDIGVETGDEQVLRQIGKGTTRKMIVDAANSARKAGLPFGCLLILGHPNETIDSIENSISLAAEINAVVPLISIMIPYPGTEVSRLAAEGKSGYELLTYDWDLYTFKASHAMNFAGLSEAQISRLHLRAYLTVYLRNRRYKDLFNLAREHWRPAMARIGRSFMGKQLAKIQFPYRPADYHEVLSGGSLATAEDISSGRESWVEYQTVELNRTRTEKHESLRVVRAV